MFNSSDKKPLSVEMAAMADLLRDKAANTDHDTLLRLLTTWLRVSARETAELERQVAQQWAEAQAWRVQRDRALAEAHADGVLVPFDVLRRRQEGRFLTTTLPPGPRAA